MALAHVARADFNNAIRQPKVRNDAFYSRDEFGQHFRRTFWCGN